MTTSSVVKVRVAMKAVTGVPSHAATAAAIAAATTVTGCGVSSFSGHFGFEAVVAVATATTRVDGQCNAFSFAALI